MNFATRIVLHILGNPGMIHSVPPAFMMNAVGTEWIMPGLPRMSASLPYASVQACIGLTEILAIPSARGLTLNLAEMWE